MIAYLPRRRSARKLRLWRVGLIKGGKLQPHLNLRQPCQVKPSIQTDIGTPLGLNESARNLHFGFYLRAEWDIDNPRDIQGPHHRRHSSSRFGNPDQSLTTRVYCWIIEKARLKENSVQSWLFHV
jgi:hypothetical protein